MDVVDRDDDFSHQLISRPRTQNQHQPYNVINPRLPKPKMKYETISIYNFRSTEEAPRRQAYLMFERLFPNSSFNSNPTMGILPLQIPSTELVDGFLRENIGSLFINGLKKRNHYEVPVSDYPRYREEAKLRGIKLRIHRGQPLPTIIREDPYQFVLHNGIDHNDMIEGLCHEKLANDLLFPSPGSIPILNARQNRGVTLGFTGSLCTSRNPTSGGIAEPCLIHGTMRYAWVFVLLTVMAKSQAKAAGFDAPFSDLTGDFATRRDFATKIHKSNEIENVTITAYIHEFAHVESFLDWLKSHFDGENCPHRTWDVAISAWKTFFLEKIGRYVTVVIIGNSRKSISDALHRRQGIGSAANELMRRFEEHPDYLKYVLASTFCPVNYNGRYRVIPVHFVQLVDLSPAIHHILHSPDWFLQSKQLVFSHL